ncbi:hypothetical protein QAD02_018814 [Eretmocerus hayati]|uniref:Uncharacterized protein n=1 Tax=Eretmocerus hayati TaxID=131215 RepID=A0ACC2PKS7_9HYME|nr:hypothetical protein QAD02_018814 [Eretmocerus hayati]
MSYMKKFPGMRPNTKNNPLHKEQAMIARMIMEMEIFHGYPEAGVNRQKNCSDSMLYRMKGNELFKGQSHSQEIHLKILERYSQSIALAPYKSEELAMAYGNRSALLQHIQKYKESIEDCNRAINITNSELLKTKLIARKLECLGALGNKSFEDEYKIALNHLAKVTLDDEVKKNFMGKIKNIDQSVLTTRNLVEDLISDKKSRKVKKQTNPSELFEHQKEIPCASTSVTIAYSKCWGRHVVATRNIQPGEIIAVEKHFHKFIFPDHLYLCCNYCTKFTWSSIPCKSCIYGVYCSKKCRAAAWEEFHQFECKIFPHMWDIAGELVAATHTARFFLNLVDKAGGIEKLRQDFLQVQKHQDPRTKGFSDDGVFYSDKARSVLGLQDYSNDCSVELEWQQAKTVTITLHHLLKETDFFKNRKGGSLTTLIPTDREIEFVGSLFLRMSYLPVTYGSQMILNKEENESDEEGKNCESAGIFLSPFCGLFNHSCDPNVRFIRSKNNETIVYAKQPIKAGEQLFRAYSGCDYLDTPKKERTDWLMKSYHFSCKCLACKNNWTRMNLPSALELLERKFKTDQIIEFHKKLQSLSQNCLLPKMTVATSLRKMFRVKGNQSQSKPVDVEEVLSMLREIAEKASVRCQEYEFLEQYVHMYYLGTFGSWLDVPEIC